MRVRVRARVRAHLPVARDTALNATERRLKGARLARGLVVRVTAERGGALGGAWHEVVDVDQGRRDR
eukprot:2335597-Prymnesium_polylepis.1